MKNFEVWAAPLFAVLVLVVVAFLWQQSRRRRIAEERADADESARRNASAMVSELNLAAMRAYTTQRAKPAERRQRIAPENAERRRAGTDDYPHHQAAAAVADPVWPAPAARSSSWMADHCGASYAGDFSSCSSDSGGGGDSGGSCGGGD